MVSGVHYARRSRAGQARERGNTGMITPNDFATDEDRALAHQSGFTIPEEVCGCGDYRHQHPNDGRCSACGGSSAPWDGCRFYWPEGGSKTAARIRLLRAEIARLRDGDGA